MTVFDLVLDSIYKKMKMRDETENEIEKNKISEDMTQDFIWLDNLYFTKNNKEIRKEYSNEITLEEVEEKVRQNNLQVFFIEDDVHNEKLMMDTYRFMKLMEIPEYKIMLLKKYNTGKIKFFKE